MWIVYDAFAGGRDERSRKETQGPMPCKRWQPDGKRHRMSYRVPQITKGPRSTDNQMQTKARDYAAWLAKRDGIELPTWTCTCIWSGVTVNGKWDRRISAVRFGTVLIELPNWDFVAVAPVETFEPEQVAA